jgi:LmbE family N-acetylglucosaminyl deacetylase
LDVSHQDIREIVTSSNGTSASGLLKTTREMPADPVPPATRKMLLKFILAIVLASTAVLAAADLRKAPPLLPPDERYKADLLLIVAHPDDDVLVGGYLAKAGLDDHKRIAVVYCTSGDGGGNYVGFEAGASLGRMRTVEARRALAFLNIENVWFLAGHDTPGQNVLWSLDNWNHGLALDEIVRMVRLTRPEVILTFLPDYVVGENHDDHQAAGVLATEAFDLAGDPTKFPEQVSAPRNRRGMMNLTEGLHVWQTKKLYYFTDAFENFTPYWHDTRGLSPFRKNFLDGRGPAYPNTQLSPSRHKSYAMLNAEQQKYYLTQEGYLGVDAIQKRDLTDFGYPICFIFGKSVVGAQVTGDIFAGVTEGPVPFVPVTGAHPETANGLFLELGGPWQFYRKFWMAHDLEPVSRLLPVPEVAVAGGQILSIPLLVRNQTAVAEEITLTSVLPGSWTDKTAYAIYPVKPGETYPVLAEVVAPAGRDPRWEVITFEATAGGQKKIGSVVIRVFLRNGMGLPQ